MGTRKYKPEEKSSTNSEKQRFFLRRVKASRVCVSDYTYYHWHNEYGGMKVDQAKRLKELETENSRLKRLVADFSPDNSILKEINSKNF